MWMAWIWLTECWQTMLAPSQWPWLTAADLTAQGGGKLPDKLYNMLADVGGRFFIVHYDSQFFYYFYTNLKLLQTF